MKYQKIKGMLSRFAAPVALCVLGLCLILRPDSAAWLISMVIGWGLLLLGAVCVFSAIVGHDKTAMMLFCGIPLILLGLCLIRHPLALATYGGIILGIWLVVDGGKQVFRFGDRSWGIVTMVAGAVLVFLPLIASRLVFTICGVVLLVVGALMLLARLRRNRLDSGSDDPNIIDVDAL